MKSFWNFWTNLSYFLQKLLAYTLRSLVDTVFKANVEKMNDRQTGPNIVQF